MLANKIILILLFLSSLYLACDQQPTTSATLIPPGESIIRDTIPFDSLTVNTGDSQIKSYHHFGDQLFSGWAIQYEQANDGVWRFIYQFENGIVRRLDVYGVNGYQHRFVEMKDGYPYHTVMFHRNGNRYLEEYYDRNKTPIGLWKRWRETGDLEWEKNYD